MKHLLFVIHCLLFAAITGCGSHKPAGVPDLHPAQVKVHDSGKPLDGIGVELYKTTGAAPYSLGGITDSSGIAKLTTTSGSGQYTGSGVPDGSYRVVLRQRIELPPELQTDENSPLAVQQEQEKKAKKYIDENRKFSQKLTNPTESPLGLEVSSSGGELDVDVSKFK
jgi:hypothetical protein